MLAPGKIFLIYSGLDIPTVEAVVNFEIPADPADYVHRIGRTARAGRGGLALSIICERDIEVVLNIESKTSNNRFYIDKKLTEFEKLSEDKVLEIFSKVSLAKRVASMVSFFLK